MKGSRFLFATKQALVKSAGRGIRGQTNRTVAATKLLEGDDVVSILVLGQRLRWCFRPSSGVFLRFALEEIPEMKNSRGVRGIKLAQGEELETVYLLGEGSGGRIQEEGSSFEPLKDRKA